MKNETQKLQPAVPSSWQEYEYQKQRWSEWNPGATPEEYQAAMLEIARKFRL